MTYCLKAVRMISDSETPRFADSSCNWARSLAGAMKVFITRGLLGSRFLGVMFTNYTTNELASQPLCAPASLHGASHE